MSHTSGLAGDPDGELSDNPRTLRASLADAVRYYGHQRLQFEPGTRWRYSNMGIAALGRIIEVVSGEEYVHFIETRILNPLGMKDTFFFPPEAKKDRIALVYKHAGGKLVRSGQRDPGGRSGEVPRGREVSGAGVRPCTRPRPTCCTFTRCCSTAAHIRTGGIFRGSPSRR